MMPIQIFEMIMPGRMVSMNGNEFGMQGFFQRGSTK